MGTFHLTLIAVFLVASVTAEKPWKRKEVDFIVVGAGAAGAAVAARLSENPENQVALLEAGGEPPYVTKIPYFSVGPMKGDVDWDYNTEKQDTSYLSYIDEKCPYSRGKGLGGSTLINAMVFTRGNRHDYDNWASLGNEGWDYESVLPYFRKMEDYQVPLQDESDGRYHGKNGPVTVSVPPYRTPLADAFLEAGKELGYNVVDHHTHTMTGVSSPIFTLQNGTRCSTNDAYIKPSLKRDNFHVVTGAHVTKVKFDSTPRATGVKFIKDGVEYYLKARKEVILSAGSTNSPPLLMLSGIGPKETLEKFEIPVVVDLPGVGQNLQDHQSTIGLLFSLDRNVGFKKEGEATPETMELWETKRQGPLTVPVRVEGISFLNSKYADPKDDYPDLEIVMAQPPSPQAPLKPETLDAFEPIPDKDVLTLMPTVMRPKSRGYITLQSADPMVPPIFQPNYLSHPDDVKVLVDGVKISLKLAETKAFQKHGVKWFGRKLPGCDAFKEFDDNYWECVVRHYTFTFFHQSGTCKMGPKTDKMAVVDSKLKVHGVSGLRVVDASIIPRITSAHTMAPAIMIGEKAADMIKEEWKQIKDEL